MQLHNFGNLGFQVPALGLGAGPLGDERLDDSSAVTLIHAALDLGVTLIDTAPSYGRSEQRIGQALRGRRDAAWISTKLGYGVPGVQDWTGPCITQGIDLALSRLQTDRLDIAHLHSCGVDTLIRCDVLEALERAKQSGKLRVAAYSGDGPGLRLARQLRVFDSTQFSHNIVDQEGLRSRRIGEGSIAKRSLMNSAFAESADLNREDVAEYHRRWNHLPTELRSALQDLGVASAAIRYAAFSPGIDCCLVGTTRAQHLEENVRALELGPLDPQLHRAIEEAWTVASWPGLI